MNKQRVEAQLQVLSKKPEARNEADLGVLEDILLGVKFASVLPLEKRLAICRHMLYECYPSNENIFKQGDTGDEFFIILSGSCTVSIMDGKTGNSTIVATLYSGDCFGELALMQEDGLRQATVTTREVCEFVKLKKEDYDSILKAYGEKSLKMKIQFLKNIPILSRLDNTAIQSLAYVLIVRDYGRNQIVCKQGQEMDDIFLLASGSCKVVREVKNFLNGKTKLPQQLGEPSNGGLLGVGRHPAAAGDDEHRLEGAATQADADDADQVVQGPEADGAGQLADAGEPEPDNAGGAGGGVHLPGGGDGSAERHRGGPGGDPEAGAGDVRDHHRHLPVLHPQQVGLHAADRPAHVGHYLQQAGGRADRHGAPAGLHAEPAVGGVQEGVGGGHRPAHKTDPVAAAAARALRRNPCNVCGTARIITGPPRTGRPGPHAS